MAIVLIDTFKSDLADTERMLRESGYVDVYTAGTYQQAYDLLSIDGANDSRTLYGVELFIIDISNGTECLDVAHKIRDTYRYQDIPILMVATGSFEEKLRTAFAFGAADFLAKPIQKFELQARVRSCLRLKHEVDRRKAREKELLEATHHLSDLNRLLTRVALIDSLTTIANRRCFDQSLEAEWRRAYRARKSLSIIMIDVDYFKKFNDTYGHQMGDECLRRVAKAVQSKLHRPGDLLARYGGEEFAVILPETTESEAAIVAENIRQAVLELQIPHQGSPVAQSVTISMGLAAAIPQNHKTRGENLVRAADQALYQAKKDGRNRIKVAPGSVSAEAPKAV